MKKINASQIGIEIPGVNSIKKMQEIVSICKEYGVVIHQVNEVIGSRLIPNSEKIEMLHLAREEKIGLTFSIFSRPEYEIDTAFYRSSWGKEIGRRLNSNKKLQYSIEEVLKLSEIGCTGVILYDIGLLSLLNKLRDKNEIKSSFVFKVSSHAGISNSETAKIFTTYGADDIIPIHDTSLLTLQEIRAAAPDVGISIIIDTYQTKGGFIRLLDLDEITDIPGSIFLKMGNSLSFDPYSADNDNTKKVVRRIAAMLENIPTSCLEKKLMDKKHRLLCIPEISN